MKFKRLTILTGHYGSGKTNIAVNMALDLKTKYQRVTLADLDIVNPYFRSADSEDLLEANGIRFIASPFVNSNVDVPALPPEMYALCDDRSSHAVIDLGGDERGALALGRLREQILEENDFDMLFVLNCYRPLTRTPEEAIEVIREIETASGLPVTGLINNSNLGAETDEATVRNSFPFADAVSKKSGIPLRATCVNRSLADIVSIVPAEKIILDLQKRPIE